MVLNNTCSTLVDKILQFSILKNWAAFCKKQSRKYNSKEVYRKWISNGSVLEAAAGSLFRLLFTIPAQKRKYSAFWIN